MAKMIEYDVEGEEAGGGGTGVKVKPGVRPAKIMRCVHRTQKRDGSPANDLEVALNVGEEYDWVFTYVGLSDAAKWKLAEFTRALGLKDKGKFDPEKQVGKVIRVKINSGDNNGEYSPDVGRLMPAQDGDEALIGQGVSEISSQKSDDGPVDESANGEGSGAEDFVPSREADEDVGSYDDWDEADLLAEVDDRGLVLPGGRAPKKAKAITALRADDEAAAGGDGDGGDDTPEADVDGGAGDDDYDSWDLEQLKKEWEDRQLGDLPNIRGRNAVDRTKAAIIEELRKDDVENPFEA